MQMHARGCVAPNRPFTRGSGSSEHGDCMNGNPCVARSPVLALLILFAVAIPLTGMAADDNQSEREARRLENEIRRQDAQALREIEMRERAQAEALRSQQESIRRMEATQARMNADAEQRAAEAEEQARRSAYIPMYPYIPPRDPGAPDPPPPPPVTPVAPALSNGVPRDPVGGIIFASVPAGVRVVSAGGYAPFGLRDGDVIIAIDGRIPVDGAHAASILRSYRPGERVKLHLQRDRTAIELATTAP